MAEVPNDGVVLLVTTFSRAQKYIPIVEKQLDALWVDHPLCYFLTDSDAQQVRDILTVRDADWVGMFL